MESVIVENVTKTFIVKSPLGLKNFKNNLLTKPQVIVGLDDVSFSVQKGEMIGIIGLNGSGKTTLLRTIGGIYQPNSGNIYVNGVLAPLLQLGTGFHQELVAHDNIMTYGMLLGMPKNVINSKIDSIIEFAELEKFRNMKLMHYSSGMKSRLAFSTVLQINPDILLVDEVLAVGDAAFKKKSFEAFLSFKKQNKTILYTSHSVGMMTKLCDRVIWLDHGKVVEIGQPQEVISRYNDSINSKL